MAIPIIKSDGEGQFIRPRDEIDPKVKQGKPEYALSFCQYVYDNYRMNASAINSAMLDRFRKNLEYAEGRQSTEKYKNWIVGISNKNSPTVPAGVDESTQNVLMDFIEEDVAMDQINFDEVFSPAPKYVANIIGIMQSQEHNVTVEATDERSGSLRDDMKWDSWVRNELKAELKKFNLMMEIPDFNEEEIKPSSIGELELFENIGAFKLAYEIGMEKLIEHTENISNFNLIKDELIADFAVYGFAAMMNYQDPNTGKFVEKHVELEDVILENSKKRDYSDSTWGGVIEWYTIHELRLHTELEEEDLLTLVDTYKGEYGNPDNYEVELVTGANGAYYKYDDFRIPVLHAFWKTIDSEYYTTKSKNGKEKTYYEPWRDGNPKVFNNDNKKTSRTDIRRIYHGRWIMNSEFVFDYGILPNSPYNYGKKDTEFPIRLYRVKGKPKIESMIPIFDQIYLTYIKMQNNIAKAPPPGLAIEMSSVENIKWGNKKLTPKAVVQIRTVSGNYLYRLSPKGLPGGRYLQGGNNFKPFEELRGGLGTAVADGIQALEFFYKQLDVISGIDALTSANVTPSRDTGKAVSEMAQAATSNVLKPIYTGYLTLREQSARCVAWMIHSFLDAYDDLRECPYYKALGLSNLLAVKQASKDLPPDYGFVIENRPTQAEKQTIYEAAKAGLAGGKNGIPALTFSEYSFIIRYLNTGRSIKYIEIWMAKKEQEAQMLQQKQAEQAQRIQGEENRKLEEAKQTTQADKIKLENEAQIQLERVKGEEERKTDDNRHKNEMELARMQIRLNLLQKNNTQNN